MKNATKNKHIHISCINNITKNFYKLFLMDPYCRAHFLLLFWGQLTVLIWHECRDGTDHPKPSNRGASWGWKSPIWQSKAPPYTGVKGPHGSERAHAGKVVYEGEGANTAKGVSPQRWTLSKVEVKMIAPPLNVVHQYFSRSS